MWLVVLHSGVVVMRKLEIDFEELTQEDKLMDTIDYELSIVELNNHYKKVVLND